MDQHESPTYSDPGPCETCGAPAVAVLQRARQAFVGDHPPRHPRCERHLSPGCAYAIDGIDQTQCASHEWIARALDCLTGILPAEEPIAAE